MENKHATMLIKIVYKDLREIILKPFFLLLNVAFLFRALVMYERSTFFLAMIVIRKRKKEVRKNFSKC